MNTPIPNQIIREITPLSDKDCFYIAERYKTEFTYPIHNHSEFELNFTEKAAGVRRVVGDSSEVIGDYDLVLITGKDLEHVWEQNECRSKEIREITIQFSSDLFFKSFINKNQFDSIRRMLDKAQKGLCFPMSAILKIYPLLDTLASEKQGFYAVIKFMTILYELSLFEEEAGHCPVLLLLRLMFIPIAAGYRRCRNISISIIRKKSDWDSWQAWSG